MQITEINQVISLILTGSAALGLVAFSIWGRFSEFLSGDGVLSAASLVVPLGASFLAMCLTLGAAVEGLAGMTLRRLLLEAANSRGVARFFAQSVSRRGFQYWHKRFVLRASECEKYSNISENIEFYASEIASAVMLARKEEHVFKWTTSNFSTGVLATNLAFLIGAFCLAIPGLHLSGQFGGATAAVALVVSLVAFYCLCAFAIHRMLYAYELSFRMLCIEMPEAREEQTDSDPSIGEK